MIERPQGPGSGAPLGGVRFNASRYSPWSALLGRLDCGAPGMPRRPRRSASDFELRRAGSRELVAMRAICDNSGPVRDARQPGQRGGRVSLSTRSVGLEGSSQQESGVEMAGGASAPASKRFQASIRGEWRGMPMGVWGTELSEHRNPEQGGVAGRSTGEFRAESSDVAPARTNRSRCTVRNRAASAFAVTACEHPACAAGDVIHPTNTSSRVAIRNPPDRCPGTYVFTQIVPADLACCIRLQTRVD